MDKEIITFDDIEIEQSKFHHHFNLILFDHLNIDDTQVSSMYYFGKKYKYFIVYKDHDYMIKHYP